MVKQLLNAGGGGGGLILNFRIGNGSSLLHVTYVSTTYILLVL